MQEIFFLYFLGSHKGFEISLNTTQMEQKGSFLSSVGDLTANNKSWSSFHNFDISFFFNNPKPYKLIKLLFQFQ